jgi:hypothetical protein
VTSLQEFLRVQGTSAAMTTLTGGRADGLEAQRAALVEFAAKIYGRCGAVISARRLRATRAGC